MITASSSLSECTSLMKGDDGAPHWGAYPRDWSALIEAVGEAGEDLLPVVCDPNAMLSTTTALKEIGKMPSQLYPEEVGGQTVYRVGGIKRWPQILASAAMIEGWREQPTYGICIQTRRVRAYDCDVNDPVLGDRIAEFTRSWFAKLGIELPERGRRNKDGSPCGRRVFAVIIEGELPKRSFKVKGGAGAIEFLGTGNQFVACGTHVKSGQRYDWRAGPPTSFPAVSSEDDKAYWKALKAEFGEGSSEQEVDEYRERRNGPDLNINDGFLTFLEEKGLILSEARGGGRNVRCPRANEHTTGADGDGSTTYFPAGTGGYERGALVCLHNHGPEINVSVLDEAIGYTAADFEVLTAQDGENDNETPSTFEIQIEIKGGDLAELADQGEAALIKAGAPLYQRGDMIVLPLAEEVPAAKGRVTHSVRPVRVTEDRLRDHLSRSARWVKRDGRRKRRVRTNPPKEVVETILSRSGEWKLPVLRGVITTPTLRPNSSLLVEAGYDAETRLLLHKPPSLPPMPAKPTRADAEEALRVLDGLLDAFPFVGAADRSVALSALIAPVVRGALSVVPLHAFSAPTAGTGKSYLVDLIAAIHSGDQCPVLTAGKTEEETEKRIASGLIAGDAIVSIDNVNGELGGAFLCQAVERPVVKVRPLGLSELVRIPNAATLFANGNNIRLVDDMVRRTLLCELDANEERPEKRQFTRKPFEEILDDRGKHIAACLTVVRAYLAAGSPAQLPTLASFEDWSDKVRSALVWLGCADPCDTMEKARADDPVSARLGALFAAWHDRLGPEARTLKQVSEELGTEQFTDDEKTDALREALSAEASGRHGNLDNKRLGYALRRYKNKVYGGLKLVAGWDGHSKATTWAVAPVAGDAGNCG